MKHIDDIRRKISNSTNERNINVPKQLQEQNNRIRRLEHCFVFLIGLIIINISYIINSSQPFIIPSTAFPTHTEHQPSIPINKQNPRTPNIYHADDRKFQRHDSKTIKTSKRYPRGETTRKYIYSGINEYITKQNSTNHDIINNKTNHYRKSNAPHHNKFPLDATSEIKSINQHHHFSKTRKLKLRLTDTHLFCNGKTFTIDFLSEKDFSWELKNKINDSVIVNQTSTIDKDSSSNNYQACIDPGPYELRIETNCSDASCYNIFVDNQDITQASKTIGKAASHFFDTSSICLVGSIFEVKYAAQSNFLWNLKENNSNQIIALEPSQQNGKENIISNFACLVPGFYRIEALDTVEESPSCTPMSICYNISLNKEVFIEGNAFPDEKSHIFAVSGERTAREQLCYKQPILSPINELNNFKHDERIARIMDILHKISSFETLQDFDSAQYKAACWVLFDDYMQVSPDSQILVQRYAIGVLASTMQLSVERAELINDCHNNAFFCNENGEMIRIDLASQGLIGTLPSELSHLRFLESLNLSSNNMIGTIPLDFGRLARLKDLRLSLNNLTGTIPIALGRLNNLEVLSLGGNLLDGTIPTELGQCENLINLRLDSNTLEGFLPTELFQCTMLKRLRIDNNNLSGTIPKTFHLLQKLENLQLNDNIFTGQLPSEMGSLSLLRECNLGHNRFSGTLPQEMENLQSLSTFYLNDNSIRGTLPDMFWNLSNLYWIDLKNNSFTGVIPNSVWELDYDDGKGNGALNLQDNSMTGTVPDGFCDKLSFQGWNTGIKIFKVDTSPWFLDEPKINCTCCDVDDCYIWDHKRRTVGGTVRPECPINSVISFEFYRLFGFRDEVVNEGFGENFDFGGIASARRIGLCASPTGCYKITTDTLEGTREVNFKSYSAASKTLVEDYILICDAVEVCGNFFDKDHPKREGLNHITQLAFPDLSYLENPKTAQYQALCWIMTKDTLYDHFLVCDGTLLQRYVMILFYHTHNLDINFDNLVTEHTCEWPGITCDVGNTFVEKIDLRYSGLDGPLIPEIGYLTRLKVLDLSGNYVQGTIDPSQFPYWPNLEVFNVGDNDLIGTLSKDLFSYPQLRELNISNNALVATIPDDIECADNIESVDMGNNLLRGTIPDSIVTCGSLKVIDLSINIFVGPIPTAFGEMKSLEVIRLHQNKISGSIPLEIFELSHLRILMLRANRLIGNIPSEISKLQNASLIILNHNSLKGTIPTELSLLENLNFLHLHQNGLTGSSPILSMKTEKPHTYISDCGNPNFLLAAPLECESCSMCCNSDGFCQTRNTWSAPIWILLLLVVALTPLGLFIFIKILAKLIHTMDNRDPTTIYDPDSVYCFILSNDFVARCMYLMTALVQVLLYTVYMEASNVQNSNTDWKFSRRCPPNNLECKELNAVGPFGWFLFCIVNTFFLGSDVTTSLLQIRRGVLQNDSQLLRSGVALFGLTAPAVFVSYVYNLASAMKNTDLITNAVILLFINDLDEKCMDLLQNLAPEWTEKRIGEVHMIMEAKGKENEDIPQFEIRKILVEESSEKSESTQNTVVLNRYESGLRMLELDGL